MVFHKSGQIKELVVLTLLSLLSRLGNSLLLKDITSTTLLRHDNPLIQGYINVAHLVHPPLNTLFVFLAPSLWLIALFSKYRIPRIALDCFGGVCVLRAVHAGHHEKYRSTLEAAIETHVLAGVGIGQWS